MNVKKECYSLMSLGVSHLSSVKVCTHDPLHYYSIQQQVTKTVPFFQWDLTAMLHMHTLVALVVTHNSVGSLITDQSRKYAGQCNDNTYTQVFNYSCKRGTKMVHIHNHL